MDTLGFAFASGLPPLSTVIMLFNSGDHIILSDNVYGGTFRVIDKVFTRFGLTYSLVNTSNLDQIESVPYNLIQRQFS